MRKITVGLITIGWILGWLIGTAPAWAKEGRMVEIILDASGSMEGKLKSGESRLEGAKKAVQDLTTKLPSETVLAFRAYGFQSSREKKDCLDTRLLAPFAPLKENRQKILDQLRPLKARGYTPITFVLTEAGKDFPADFKGDKMIILITDGKETCEGDPCALAKSLAKAEARLVIHTVGFGVNEATKQQMECVARAAGGKYFAAEDPASLTLEMGKALETAKTILREEKGQGTLVVEGACLAGHQVTRVETGAKVATLSHVQSSVKLPAGIYNVTVGKAIWKSVEVLPNQTTVLRPGFIKVENASLIGHKIIETETGLVHGSVSNTQNNTALMPGDYLVLFGKIPWPVIILPGQTTTLRPGLVSAPGADINGYHIKNSAGEVVGGVSQTKSTEPLPPGNYYLERKGKKIPFTLKEGETFTFSQK
ncbi:MAG: VWA domain-containing protein [Thermodesulfobacteriota bacterium]